MKQLLLSFAALLMAFSAFATVTPITVTNGGFSGSLTGWTSSGWIVGTNSAAATAAVITADGVTTLPANLSQTITIPTPPAGESPDSVTISFTFDWAAGTGADPTDLNISFDGVTYATIATPNTATSATVTAANNASVSPATIAAGTPATVTIMVPATSVIPGQNYVVSLTAGSTNALAFNTMAVTNAAMDLISIAPLSVTLKYFDGRSLQNSVLLNWETGSEDNVAHFEVEQSFDGKLFTTAGTITAQGAGKPYYFQAAKIDASLVYFRLRSVDRDGSYQYSHVLPFKMTGGNNDVSIYPNPVTDQVVIRNLKPDELYQVRVLNIAGQVVYHSEQAANAAGIMQITGFDMFGHGSYIFDIAGKDRHTQIQAVH